MRKTAAQRGYDSEWRLLRAAHLRREPHCRMCAAQGLRVPARHVDHVTAHRGNGRLLMDPGNLQSLCITHHNAGKQQEERRGYRAEVSATGLPVDPRHPFLKG